MFKNVRLNDAILKFYQRSQPIAFSNAETLYDDLVLLRDQILMYGDLSEAQTNYLNEFIENFDTSLKTTVRDIFEKWLSDGFLVDLIRDIINEEVTEARDGEARLNIRLNRDKQDSDNKITILQENEDQINAQLVETATQVVERTGHYEKYYVEKGNTTHASGFDYTAFGSGAMIKGKEIYVIRSGAEHNTDPNNFGVLIAYTRQDDGSFTSYVLPLDYVGKEYRDPNITTSSDGNHLILTASAFDGVSTYTGYLWILDEHLTVVSGPQLIDDNIFLWGNSLTTPNGYLLKCGYTLSTPYEQVYLYKSTGKLPNFGTFEKIPLFIGDTTDFNECTISYWGDKLVAISRTGGNGKGYYKETYDLEGQSGWSTQRFLYPTMDYGVHAPCLEPYIPKGEPLVISYSRVFGGERLATLMFTPNGTDWSTPFTIDNEALGGYTTLVRNKFGYGVMYYGERGGSTDLLFKDIDIYKSLPNLKTWEYSGGKNLKNDWINVTTYENSFKSYGGSYGTPRYKKARDVVTLDGMTGTGTASVISTATTIFTLPVGFRPNKDRMFTTVSALALGVIVIKPTGEVQVIKGDTSYVSLEGISFTIL